MLHRNTTVEIVSVIVSILTLLLLYQRFQHDKKSAANRQQLLDLQVELHKQQIVNLKENRNA